MRLEAGESVTVLPGTPHKFWNDGAEPVVFRCVVRPALQFESLIETMFTLAEEGRTNRKGMPNPVRMAAIARAHRDVIRLAGVPVWLQDLGTLAAMPLAYVCGYTAPRPQPALPVRTGDQGGDPGGDQYSRTRWTAPAGPALLEILEHSYQTVADGPEAAFKGHCIPGSTVDAYAPAYAVACAPPNAFVWGAEIVRFFDEHPRAW